MKMYKEEMKWWKPVKIDVDGRENSLRPLQSYDLEGRREREEWESQLRKLGFSALMGQK